MTLSKSQKKLGINIIAGAFLFTLALALKHFVYIGQSLEVFLLTASYIILGHKVLFDAAKNIKKGKIFDENFLMCIATIGAYILKDYTECVAVMLFYQVGEFFQSYAVAKSRKSIKDLMDICPEYANIEKDGVLTEVDPFEVEPGDIIMVKPGEKIPLDGVVTEGASSLDMASLTGESLPKDVCPGEEILSGSINLTSNLKIKVTKSFENSTVSKILELVENSGFNKAKSEKFITRFSSVYTPLVVICAVLTAFVPPLFWGSFALWFKRALIFLVISCPCALVISVPLSFFASIGCASKHGILIKGANYLELLGKLETIVFDKTGTLTKGNFTVSEIHSENCNTDELIRLASIAEYYSDHPVAKSIKDYSGIKAFDGISDFTNMAGLGVCATYEGKKIYAGNSELMNNMGIAAAKPKAAGTAVHISCDDKYMGYILISDSIKDDALAAIKEIKKSGIKTCMLTGDLDSNASLVAKKLGIDKYYSQLLPQDKVVKLNEIIAKKSSGKKAVGYVGDGINDAPVLASADVGIAMGSLGSDAAIEAADIVITDDKLIKIALACKICRKTNRIVKENVVFAIGIKLLVMVLGVFGIANMWTAVFADVGVAFIAILNSMRAFKI